MTGGDEGSGRLIVPLPWVRQEFGSERGGPIFSPEGWPQLPRPALGKTLAAFLDHAVAGDPFLQLVRDRTSDSRPLPALDGRRPADLTLAWWETKWPYKVSHWLFDEPLRHGYHRDRVFWRLGVEFIARWEASDLVVKGRRLDVSASEVEVVEPGWLRNHFMVLRPHERDGGWFGPEKWERREPPSALPQYCDLTVWPAKASEALETPAEEVPSPPPQTSSEAYTACVACLRAIAGAALDRRSHTRPELKDRCKGQLGEDAWRAALKEAFKENTYAKWSVKGGPRKP